jgi:hypothetical protein
MGRGGDDDGVEVRLLQHFTEVAIAFAGVLELLHHRVSARGPGVTSGGNDDVGLLGASAEVGAAHAAAADEADVNAAVRAGLWAATRLRGSDKVRGGEAEGGKRGGLSEEGAAGDGVVPIHEEEFNQPLPRIHCFFL